MAFLFRETCRHGMDGWTERWTDRWTGRNI